MTLAEQQSEIARLEALLADTKAKPGVVRPRRMPDGTVTAYVSTKSKDWQVQHLEWRIADVRKQKVNP